MIKMEDKELTAIEKLKEEGFIIINNTDDPKYNKVIVGKIINNYYRKHLPQEMKEFYEYYDNIMKKYN